jgi:hypothetical protein
MVSMKYSLLTLPVLLAMSSAVPAQQPVITPETPVTSSILHQWLQSGDPRLIAWAADFARRTHDAIVLAEMPQLIEHWNTPQFSGIHESQAAERRAAIAVLDALIQENVQVPVSTVRTVAATFSSQALILISRMPLSASRETLDGWTYRAHGSWSGPLLARVASMMLAKEPDSSFVARVVAAAEENLYVSVTSGGVGSGSGGGSCGDSFGASLFPGWPQVYRYELLENDPNVQSPAIVDLDGDRIASLRVEENAGWGSCGDQVEELDPVTRHRLIAHWLGVQDEDVPWKPAEQISIVWTNKADYEYQLGAAIEAQRQKLRATVETLRQRRFLTGGDAETTAPRLVVTIKCDMKPCPLM